MNRTTKGRLGCLGGVALLIGGCVVVTHVGDFPPRAVLVAEPPGDVAPIKSEWYHGFDSSNVVPRHIGMVEGTFTLGTWITVELHSVRTGHVETVMGSSVGRSPNQYPRYLWSNMRIIVALGDDKRPGYTLTSLGCIGVSCGTGGGGPLSNNIQVAHSRVFAGPLPAHSEYLLYVAGDRAFEATRDTPLTTFAKEATGNFMVVTVKRN